MKAGRIQIYDTTLRDGAQGRGISFSTEAKLRLARRLDEFGADYVEGGFAGSSRQDMAFFAAARKLPLRRAKIVAFGHTRRVGTRVGEDHNVVKLLEARTPAAAVVGKAWRLHVRDVLRTSERENRAMIADTVRCLKSRGREVLFDAEHFFDGYKECPAFAMSALRAAAGAGADALVLCDTNGGALCHEVHDITKRVVAEMGVPVAIHTHNDMGLAVANSVEAVRAGAVQVQGTLNGYGERCGNANLCALIPVLQLKMGFACVSGPALAGLRGLSVFASDLVNVPPDDAAPFVGANAFAHKAGLHADAVRKRARAVEHIDPARVGNRRHILLSEAAGKASVLLKAEEMAIPLERCSPAEVAEVLAALKALEQKGYAFETADASFRILVQKVLRRHRAFFDLEGFRVIVEKRGKNEPCISEATLKLRVGGRAEHTAGEGDGPVDALNTALRRALTRFYPSIEKVHLKDFRVRILDPDQATGATTRVLIESGDGRETWGTVGVSQNIIEASWQALVDSVEYKLFSEEERRARRPSAGKRDRGRSPA